MPETISVYRLMRTVPVTHMCMCACTVCVGGGWRGGVEGGALNASENMVVSKC